MPIINEIEHCLLENGFSRIDKGGAGINSDSVSYTKELSDIAWLEVVILSPELESVVFFEKLKGYGHNNTRENFTVVNFKSTKDWNQLCDKIDYFDRYLKKVAKEDREECHLSTNQTGNEKEITDWLLKNGFTEKPYCHYSRTENDNVYVVFVKGNRVTFDIKHLNTHRIWPMQKVSAGIFNDINSLEDFVFLFKRLSLFRPISKVIFNK